MQEKVIYLRSLVQCVQVDSLLLDIDTITDWPLVERSGLPGHIVVVQIGFTANLKTVTSIVLRFALRLEVGVIGVLDSIMCVAVVGSNSTGNQGWIAQ